MLSPAYGFLLPALVLLHLSRVVLLAAAIALIYDRNKHAVTAAVGSGAGFLIGFLMFVATKRW